MNWYRAQLQCITGLGTTWSPLVNLADHYCDIQGKAMDRHSLYYEERYYKAAVWFTLRDINSKFKLRVKEI